jgi:TfoX/Sxy family transcriptional regulator of competence genes
MAYDERMAERVRELITARPEVTERKMFGGIGWMLAGNMAVGVMSTGGLIVRVDPDEADAWLSDPHVGEFGREGAKPMNGFVVVDPDALENDAELERWIDVGAARAASLPPK